MLRDTNERESQSVPLNDTWIILDYWWNLIREEEIKSVGTEEESTIQPRSTLDRAQARPPRFVLQLSALRSKASRHDICAFLRLVTTTQLPSQIGFVTNPESLEFDWVSGRESWRMEKKA